MNKKILVVDDEENVRKTMRRVLDYTKAEIITASNGIEAVNLAASEKPDLILLDINMPKMDGNQTMRELRKNPSTKFIPVIMLTGNGEVIDRVVGYELGVQDYITKPFEIAELKKRVGPFVEQKKASAD